MDLKNETEIPTATLKAVTDFLAPLLAQPVALRLRRTGDRHAEMFGDVVDYAYPLAGWRGQGERRAA